MQNYKKNGIYTNKIGKSTEFGMQAIHLSTAQMMMQRPDPVDLTVWRALTELDAQAADYEDMQRQMKNV